MSYDSELLSSVQHLHVANLIIYIFGKSVAKFDTFINLIRSMQNKLLLHQSIVWETKHLLAIQLFFA